MRRQKRTKAVVSVRLGIDGDQRGHLAHTLDVSDHGLKLGGFQGELKVGDVIEVLSRHQRARFRMVWIVAHPGSSEKQIGAECVQPERKLWAVDSAVETDEHEGKE